MYNYAEASDIRKVSRFDTPHPWLQIFEQLALETNLNCDAIEVSYMHIQPDLRLHFQSTEMSKNRYKSLSGDLLVGAEQNIEYHI